MVKRKVKEDMHSLRISACLFSLQRTSVHSFASSSRNSQLSFRRKTSSTATIQPDKDSSDDDDEIVAADAPATSTEGTKQCTDVYMSVHISHEKVGCAVYDFKTGRVSLLEDCPIDIASSSRLSHSNNSMDEDDESEVDPDSAMEDIPARSQSADVIMSSR